MKATDLRLGNYFQSNIIQQVQIEHLEFLLNDKLDHSVMQPIPLSEDWLLKMGFEQPGYDFNELQLDYNDGEIIIDINDRIYIGTNEFYVKDVPLHRLQNLYFALTGEELTIKEL